MKGDHTEAIARFAEFESSGLTKFVYKTDQENSIKAVSEQTLKKAELRDDSIKDTMEEAVKRSTRSGTHIPFNTPVPEWSAVGESASNDRAERTMHCLHWKIGFGIMARGQDTLQPSRHQLDGRAKRWHYE